MAGAENAVTDAVTSRIDVIAIITPRDHETKAALSTSDLQGSDWRGAPVDALRVHIHAETEHHEPGPAQKVLVKAHSIIVLEAARAKPTQRCRRRAVHVRLSRALTQSHGGHGGGPRWIERSDLGTRGSVHGHGYIRGNSRTSVRRANPRSQCYPGGGGKPTCHAS